MPAVDPTAKVPDWDGLWWVSTSFATFGVSFRSGRVFKEASAPISYKFAGQPAEILVKWLRKDRAFKMVKLMKPGERISEELP